MAARFTMRVAVHVLLRKGGQVLLLQRQGTGFEDGNYSVIAGHLDGNESAKTAMVREAMEEAGIAIDESDLDFGCVVHRNAPDREYVDFFFTCSRWQGEIANAEPHKCSGLRFFPIDRLPENTVGYVAASIKAVEQGVKYVEFGWKKQ